MPAGDPHDLRIEGARGLAAAVRRDGHAPAEGRGHRHPRQDQHGRVRHGLLDRALRLRTVAQPLGPRPHPRRVGRGLGRGRRVLPGAAGDRHRHRWLDPAARRRDRHGRHQADLRRGVPLRPRGAGVVAGPGRALRPLGARRSPAARGDRRARPARLHLDRRTAARPGRRGAASRTSAVCGSGLVKQLGGEGYQPGVEQRFSEAVELLVSLGADGRGDRLPELRLRAGGLLPDPAERGVLQPREVRRHALRPARR